MKSEKLEKFKKNLRENLIDCLIDECPTCGGAGVLFKDAGDNASYVF